MLNIVDLNQNFFKY